MKSNYFSVYYKCTMKSSDYSWEVNLSCIRNLAHAGSTLFLSVRLPLLTPFSELRGWKAAVRTAQFIWSNFARRFGYKYLPKNYGYSFINISANSVLIIRTWIENFASPLSPHLPTMLSHPNNPFQNPSQLSIPEDHHVIKSKDSPLISFLDFIFYLHSLVTQIWIRWLTQFM